MAPNSNMAHRNAEEFVQVSSLQEGQKVAQSTGANTPTTNQEIPENSSQESPEGHETKDTAPEETADKRKVRAHIPHIFFLDFCI